MGKRGLTIITVLAAFLLAVATPDGIGRPAAGRAVPGAGSAAGVDLTCSLALAKFDPNVINVAYPDQAALYFTSAYVGAPGAQIEIDGIYAHGRYTSFTVYDPAERPLDAVNDVHITPSAGSANPFLTGASRLTPDAQRH